MIRKLKTIVTEAIGNTASPDDWRDIRRAYFWYSYLSFLIIAVSQVDKSEQIKHVEDMLKSAVKARLLDETAAQHLITLPYGAHIFNCLRNHIRTVSCEINISELYQEYISQDFTVADGCFFFKDGKFGKDILGAYYTSEKFSFEITRKAMDDYIYRRLGIREYSYNSACQEEVRGEIMGMNFLDSACGSGEFLISVIRYCKEYISSDAALLSCLSSHIVGIDVDPLALLISRVRVYQELKQMSPDKNFILGNPLAEGDGAQDPMTAYHAVAEGRFYNSCLAVNMDDRKYSVILGNPPWEKIRFEEKKFFLNYTMDLAAVNKKADREHMIQERLSGNNLRSFYRTECYDGGA